MLVVKVELWPGGDEDASRELGRMKIANVGGTRERGDYAVLMEPPPKGTPEGVKWCRAVTDVRGHERLEAPVWSLVAKALIRLGCP